MSTYVLRSDAGAASVYYVLGPDVGYLCVLLVPNVGGICVSRASA
jgi:hypothetical protein